MYALRQHVFFCFVAAIFLEGMLPATNACAQSARKYVLPEGKSRTDIHPAEFYIKFKEDGFSGGRTLGTSPDLTLSTLAEKIPVQAVAVLDPAANGASNARVQPSTHLRNLYRVTLSEGDVVDVLNDLLQYRNVAYAEPVYRETLFLVPNDPNAALNTSTQTYLSAIKAYDAWNITQGDSTIIIGIVDTGAEYTHEDLAANIYYKTADPIDGIDNDNNGYIDDYRGWDFANNDNNPVADGSSHGTQVTGIAAARTNNGKGIAGTGYLSKYFPLKAFKTADNTSFGTYEAIIYAANNGVDVLNLSWGSADSYSMAAQDIINYAVLEKNVIVVAAAGNTDAELTFYPASYDHVLSVGASNVDGTKSSFGTYGYYLDLIAPGANIYSTRNGNSYGNGNGSSFAAPMAAGAAALLKAKFPQYSALQLMEQLRVTATSVDGLSGNAAYKGLLGKGLLNMHRALTDTVSPSVRLAGDSLYSQAGQQAFYGDTIHLALAATNWLRPATGLQISLEADPAYATVLPVAWAVPALSAFDTTRKTVGLVLNEDVPPNTRIVVKTKMEATAYSDFQYLEFTTAPDTASLASTSIELTLASDGDLGYTADLAKEGKGFRYNAQKILEQAGFLVGTGKDLLADNMVDNLATSARTSDFEATKHLKFFAHAAPDYYYENTFTAALAENQDLLVEQKTFAWEQPADSNFMVTEYRVTNTTGEALPGLYAGLFSNWQLATSTENHTVWVDSLQLGLTYSHGENLYAGIALLTAQPATFFAADIDNANGNTADTDVILTDSTKFAWLSASVSKTTAGAIGNGNNTAQLNGVSLGELAANASGKVAFAWVAADSPADVVKAVQQAQQRYAEFNTRPRPLTTVYACKDQPATITLTGGSSWNFYGDPQGVNNLLHQGNSYQSGVISEPTTIYVRNTDNPYIGEVYAVNVYLDPLSAEFEATETLVLLENGSAGTVSFKSTGENASTWAWDFGNGFASTVQAPQTTFDKAGVYTVGLSVTSAAGCSASEEKQITVAHRAPAPLLENQYVCKNTSAIIKASNASKIRVYSDAAGNTRLFEGAEFTTGPIGSDTLFYVANADSLYESRPVQVAVQLNSPVASFAETPDTTTFTHAVRLTSTSSNATGFEWFVNGQAAGETSSISVPVAGAAEMTVRLVTTNATGCSDEITRQLSFQKSATPVVGNGSVCPGLPYTAAPQNGSTFLFLNADGEPVHKGRTYTIPAVTDTTVVVVIGLDNFIESDPVEISVSPFVFRAGFSVLPARLILENQKTARFTDTSLGATSWNWKINGKLTEISRDPVLAFDSAGVYGITLIIKNASGCTDSVSIDYQVLAVAGVNGNARSSFSIFPNPAGNVIYLATDKTLYGQLHIQLYDAAGILKKSVSFQKNDDQPIAISTVNLASGIYFVKIESNEATETKRFIKE